MACEDQQVLTNKQTENRSRHEDQIALEEPSVMVRLGPNSVDMTEEELEAAFSRLSLAFRCDQYTLCQRLETEEHARDDAEDNLKLEVERGMEVLEEAKVSRAVELMLAHVENLKHRHERNRVELEEMKKQMEKSSRERHVCEQWEETDTIEKLEKDPQKPQLRRRISTNIIAKQIQRQKTKESEAIFSSVTNEISEEIKSTTKKPDHTDDLQLSRGQVVPQDDIPSQTASVVAPEDASSVQIHPNKTLRLELDSNMKHKFTASVTSSKSEEEGVTGAQSCLAKSERCLGDCDRCVISLQRPLMQWMYRCHWIVLVIYLTVLCSIIILAILVWLLQTPVLWM